MTHPLLFCPDPVKRACTRKIAYKSVAKVRKAVIKMMNKVGIECDYYECQHCGQYHLTKKRAGS